MIYGTEDVEVPIRYMLSDVPEDAVLGGQMVLANCEERNFAQIVDCHETSDGQLVFEYIRRDEKKMAIIRKEDLFEYYLFYIHSCH